MWVCRLPVHIAPAGWTVFSEIFGKFAAAQRADVGIGPYGICMSAYGFARDFRKINCISAGRTESSAPTGICNPG